MLHSGKFWVKLGLPSGTAFPTSPAPEESDCFYRTDEDKFYIYDGSTWNEIGAGGGGDGGAWTLIEDVELGAPAANIDFQNIPGTYKYLVIMYSLRSDVVSEIDELDITFNNSAAGYDWVKSLLYAANAQSTSDALNDSAMTLGNIPADSSPANSFGGGDVHIYDYADTVKKTSAKLTGGMVRLLAGGKIYDGSGFGEWRTVSAVTRITLTPAVGNNWVAGSRATLYGIS